MKTVISHILTLPQPYLNEALQARDPKYDDIMISGICAALMLALPEGTIRDTILKAWNRGEFAAKHVGQPEARVDMAMPELKGDPIAWYDEHCSQGFGIMGDDWHVCNDDQFQSQLAADNSNRAINHEAY